MRALPLVVLLLGCPPIPPKDTGDDADPVDTAGDSDTDTGDTAAPPVDEDRDGYDSSVDCEDNDYQVYPGAPEDCDGVDDDCDGLVDEDFDADQDGHFAVDVCEAGDDCDDADATTYTGATETPYDDVDQDCDGADLTDVDDDGYDIRFDCDDEDATAHPDGTEVPKNGVDEDCDGTDDLDADDDGWDDEAWDGLDCDDADATIHPDALDLMNDGLDSDCDGADGLPAFAGDVGVTIAGASGDQDLVGESVAVCDLDGDGWQDLVVTAPFSDSYGGTIGVWYGDGSAAWTAGMAMSDADTVITDTSLFMGFGLACADVDGDGVADLVSGRGEIHADRTYDTDYALLVWYGAGGRWAAALDDRDAIELSTTLGVTSGEYSVYNRDFVTGDLDGDGADEILVVNEADADLSEADDTVWIVPGARYTRAATLESVVQVRVTPDSSGAWSHVEVLDDGVWFGQGGYTADTADTGTQFPGRASWADAPDATGLTVADWARATLEGSGDVAFGWDLALGDFDGDGLEDAAVSALIDSTTATEGGGVYAFSDIATTLTGIGVDGAGAADGHIAGEEADALFGYLLEPTGDLDGDGAEELLVSEVYGSSGYGQVWLLSGAKLTGGLDPDDAALARWTGEAAASYLANALASGDLDGDGKDDLVFAAYAQADDGSAANGRVYVVLTGG